MKTKKQNVPQLQLHPASMKKKVHDDHFYRFKFQLSIIRAMLRASSNGNGDSDGDAGCCLPVAMAMNIALGNSIVMRIMTAITAMTMTMIIIV